MSWLPPLLVAIPLLAAAIVAGGDHVMPTRVQDALGVGAAAATCALGVLLMLRAEQGEVIHWFGGWRPRGGISIGIDFAVDPLAGAMTALVGLAVLLSLLYARAYLCDAGRLVDALLLVCLGAMCGFAMSGDLFNMFVWLELMGVAAYALTGFEVKQLGPLQGAVNFAIVNTTGGYLLLIGIALVYARTGALNLAQIGHALAGRRPDGLVVVALTLIVCGFLCKAAVLPFHLWLADAYAVAPAPICAMFAAVMTDIGLFGVARVYWTGFDGSLGARQPVGELLLWLGVLTALLGGTMAFVQRHLKRMLAYSVVCHIGVMLAGIGLLSAKGLAGTADMLLAHGLLTAGLFFASGIVLAWLRSVDELRLRGAGRGRPWLAAIWFAAALALAGPPYAGVYLGHSLIDEAAADGGRHWVQPLLWLGGAVASAALLRAGARIFLGWGDDEDPVLGPRTDERPPDRRPAFRVLGPIAALATALGIVVSVVPGLAQRTEDAAARFRDRAAYARFVLHGVAIPHSTRLPFTVAHTTTESLLYGVGATLLALALAAFGLYRTRLRGSVYEGAARVAGPLVATLKAVHSGVIGDYVMWLTVGVAAVGGVWALTLR